MQTSSHLPPPNLCCGAFNQKNKENDRNLVNLRYQHYIADPSDMFANPISDVVSYEGVDSAQEQMGPLGQSMGSYKFANVLSIKQRILQESANPVSWSNLHSRRKSGADYVSLEERASQMKERVEMQYYNQNMRSKPSINPLSKLLAQNKRQNEPVYERLHKHDTLSKRIALEVRAHELLEKDRLARPKSQSTIKK